MNQRIFEKFYWQNRKSRVATNLALFIGNHLCHGSGLIEALTKAAEEIDDYSQKKVLLKTIYKIKKSQDYEFAFRNRSLIMKGKDKYILGSSLTDLQKGKIIKNWSEYRYHGSDVISYLLFLVTFAVLGSTIFICATFTLPQFCEINLGMGIPLNTFLSLFNSFGKLGFIILLFGLVIFIAFIISLISLANNNVKMQEEADFLSVLSAFDKDEQWKIIDSVLNKRCFPNIFNSISKVMNNIKNGENINDCLADSKISSYMKWFLQLSFFDNDRTVLKEGSIILNERIMLSSISYIKFFEVIIVIIESLVFLFVAYGFYSSLNSILLGCL